MLLKFLYRTGVKNLELEFCGQGNEAVVFSQITETIYKILDLKTEKARYDAENNGSGSIVHIKGTVPVADAKPKSLGQKLAESVNNKLSKKR